MTAGQILQQRHQSYFPIIIRFELEQELLNDDLSVADLPGAWREKYRDYLGVEPSSDDEGVLQDIHWSAGLIGYFPTYTLGKLISVQLSEQSRHDITDFDAQIEAGKLIVLKHWLNQKIHR